MEFAGGYQDKVSLIVANYHLKLLHFMFTGCQLSVKQKRNYITASALSNLLEFQHSMQFTFIR